MSSNTSRISTHGMESILEKLKCQCMRDSTARNYLGVWRQFNKFMTKLNSKPNSWEQQASLFGAYLVDNGVQSSTLKSYISAIKITLTLDRYHSADEKVLLGTLMKACQIMNDRIQTRIQMSGHGQVKMDGQRYDVSSVCNLPIVD